jgi:two-component system nitrate/nitrite response regulator NarL
MTDEPNTPDDTPRLRVIVAHADATARHAFAELLRAPGGIVVVAQAGTAVEALELTAHYRPDVLLAHEALIGEAAFAPARQLCDDHPEVVVVMLTPGPLAAHPLDALRAGVTSILPQDSDPDAIVSALHASAGGDALIDPAVTRALIDQLRQSPTPESGLRPIHSSLSNREWQILGLMSDGLSPKDIAATLSLSQDTVYTHTRNIQRKLHVDSPEAAVRAAREAYRAVE